MAVVAVAGRQVEVAMRFVVGIEVEGVYMDELAVIAWVYVSSVRRFWSGNGRPNPPPDLDSQGP